MTQDRPLLGMGLMLGFCIIAPLADALAKLLGSSMSIGELVSVRILVQVLLLAPIVWWSGVAWNFSLRVLRLAAIRGVLHIVGIALMFLSLRYLPLADAVAIAFVMPFIMLGLGHFVLHEEVGPRRIIACCIGFVGTLMVMQPSFVEVGWPATLPLGVAVVFSLFMLVTRQVAKEIDPMALQVISGAAGLVILVPILMLGVFRTTEPTVVGLDAWTWGLLLAMGVLGTLGHLLMTWSLRFAPSATLAPMQYIEIPMAALLGWLIFQDFPNGIALMGIVVTISAGLYIIAREQSVSRSARSTPAEAPPEGS